MRPIQRQQLATHRRWRTEQDVNQRKDGEPSLKNTAKIIEKGEPERMERLRTVLKDVRIACRPLCVSRPALSTS